MKNMFCPIEFRLKEEIGKDAKPYRSWWNDIAKEWEQLSTIRSLLTSALRLVIGSLITPSYLQILF
jgi:hypothetical protein